MYHKEDKTMVTRKPTSLIEARHMEALGMTREEYRYSQACAWAILMGEQLPDKNEFMAKARKEN